MQTPVSAELPMSLDGLLVMTLRHREAMRGTATGFHGSLHKLEHADETIQGRVFVSLCVCAGYGRAEIWQHPQVET